MPDTITILELAANIRQKKSELETTCVNLRGANGDWISYSLAAEDAMRIADDGLRNCWTMLDRLHNMAKDELARIDKEGK